MRSLALVLACAAMATALRNTFDVGLNVVPRHMHADVVKDGVATERFREGAISPMVVDSDVPVVIFHAFLNLTKCADSSTPECNPNQDVSFLVQTKYPDDSDKVRISLAEPLNGRATLSDFRRNATVTARIVFKCLKTDHVGFPVKLSFDLLAPEFGHVDVFFTKKCISENDFNRNVYLEAASFPDNILVDIGGDVVNHGAVLVDWHGFDLWDSNNHMMYHNKDNFYLWLSQDVPAAQFSASSISDLQVVTVQVTPHAPGPIHPRRRGQPAQQGIEVIYHCEPSEFLVKTVITTVIGGLCANATQYPCQDDKKLPPLYFHYQFECGNARPGLNFGTTPDIVTDVIHNGVPTDKFDPSQPDDHTPVLTSDTADFLVYGTLELPNCVPPDLPPECHPEQVFFTSAAVRWPAFRTVISVETIRLVKVDTKVRLGVRLHFHCNINTVSPIPIEVHVSMTDGIFRGFSFLVYKNCNQGKPRHELELRTSDPGPGDKGDIITNGEVTYNWNLHQIDNAQSLFQYDSDITFYTWLQSVGKDEQKFEHFMYYDETVIDRINVKFQNGNVIRERVGGGGASNAISYEIICKAAGDTVITAAIGALDHPGYPDYSSVDYSWLKHCDAPAGSVRTAMNVGMTPVDTDVVRRGVVQHHWEHDAPTVHPVLDSTHVLHLYLWLDLDHCERGGLGNCEKYQDLTIDVQLRNDDDAKFLEFKAPASVKVTDTIGGTLDITMHCKDVHPDHMIPVVVTLHHTSPQFPEIKFAFAKLCFAVQPRVGLQLSESNSNPLDRKGEVVSDGVAARKWHHLTSQNREHRVDPVFYGWLNNAVHNGTTLPAFQSYELKVQSDAHVLTVDVEASATQFRLGTAPADLVMFKCRYHCWTEGSSVVTLSFGQLFSESEVFAPVAISWIADCGGTDPIIDTQEPPERGMSAVGTFFLVLFLVLLSFGVLGCAFKRFQLGQTGFDMVPFSDSLLSCVGKKPGRHERLMGTGTSGSVTGGYQSASGV